MKQVRKKESLEETMKPETVLSNKVAMSRDTMTLYTFAGKIAEYALKIGFSEETDRHLVEA